MTTKRNPARHWDAWWLEHESGYREIASWDPFDGWTRSTNPDWTVDTAFSNGLSALICGDRGLAKLFLNNALVVAQRATREGRTDHGSSPLFPLNRARLLRASGYAKALLKGRLPITDLEQASTDFRTVSEGLRGDRSSVQERALYRLSSLRIELVLGHIAHAADTLDLGTSRYHAEEYEIWSTLIPSSRSRAPALQALERYYRKVQPPVPLLPGTEMNEIHILRLELAAIRHLYRSRGRSIPWRQLLSGIACGA
jgi:hypothetical protein